MDVKEALRTQIKELRAEVERLQAERDRLATRTWNWRRRDRQSHDCPGCGLALGQPERRRATSAIDPVPGTVIDPAWLEGDDEAAVRAFDDFYSAYDDVHVKTRKFLLG